MSNLSDVGFPVRGQQDVNELIEAVLRRVERVPCSHGYYLRFTDISNAQLYLQANDADELVGFNPHFDGQSRLSFGILEAVEGENSELDGSFYGWLNPLGGGENDELTGDFPLVFDVPDFRINQIEKFPHLCRIQLTAFAAPDFQIFETAQDFRENQQTGFEKLEVQSFVPSGLFVEEGAELPPLRSTAVISGTIKSFARRTNSFSGADFFSFSVETDGGEIDVVADSKLVTTEPQNGALICGNFWLSGRIIAS